MRLNDYDGVGDGDAEAGVAHIQYVSSTGVQDLFHTTLLVRSDVMAVENTMSWPPRIVDFDDEDITLVPSSVCNLLALIIDGDARNDISEDLNRQVCVKNGRVHLRVLSIAQDVLFCTREDCIKTPKHVLLPVAVQHLTRNAQLVALLNRVGHGFSYDQVEEAKTALAEQALIRDAKCVPLSSHIDQNVPVVFAADNNKLLEETPTGANTTHCTSSIGGNDAAWPGVQPK